ncbi:MAG: alkaline phosphatase family protein [Phycisphaerae bacterium]
MPAINKIAVIGLDCAEPGLVFDAWLDRLPNIRRLMQSGLHGQLESCMPPITVPAWSCMTTSKDPGTLGVYGFRNRKDHTYDGLSIATNLAIKEPRVWDLLAAAGKKSISIGVPQTYPITRPPNGLQVTCFLTPGIDSDYTHPKELKQEIASVVGEYIIDCKDFRTENKKWLLEQIYEMTDKRFKLCKHLLATKPWDLFWMVEMGTDRIHHGFWQFMDKQHHRYEAGNPFEHAIRDYYAHLDKLIGELLETIELNTTAVWIVSDHGAKRMDGGFCFNDWLIREGLLTMKQPVTAKNAFKFDEVDWTKTKVWGEGGYYARCFINREGRESQGQVKAAEYEAFRDEMIRRIEALRDHRGRPMNNRAYKPENIYRKVNGVAPDLVVIFGDLHWRSVGTIGNPDVYTFENDTGPDDANHAQQGMYILSHPSLGAGKRRDASLYDVTPTILKMMGQKATEGMVGTALV